MPGIVNFVENIQSKSKNSFYLLLTVLQSLEGKIFGCAHQTQDTIENYW